MYLHAESNDEKTGYCKLLLDIENRLPGYGNRLEVNYFLYSGTAYKMKKHGVSSPS